MKAKVSSIRKLAAIAVALFLSTILAFADGEITEVYLTGTSHSSAGDFVVQTTEDIFHYQGMQFEVYKVFYDDPEMNMKIAVNMDGRCTSFAAYNGEFIFFYNCNRDGFGVRKVMFSNPWAKDRFDCREYHDQSVLLKQRRIEKKDAVGLIAAYVPQLRI